MKIITNYKDYYDHVAHMYGGGDPKIVYARPYHHEYIPDIKWLGYDFSVSVNNIRYKCKSLSNLHYLWESYPITPNNIDVMGIVIGDIIFTKIKKHEDNDYRFLRTKDIGRHRLIYRKASFDEFINHKDSSLIDICRAVKMPVFSFIIGRYDFHIDNRMPNLGKLGIPTFISAHDMYQHLSYFVGNLMHKTPDTMKADIIPDKIKIESHGFDYKSSFRGKIS